MATGDGAVPEVWVGSEVRGEQSWLYTAYKMMHIF